jgi:predicted short-subunit dehydrogenase-like oxidoreductase (DUF2520 family)
MLSGATPLSALGYSPRRFALHPAQTLSRDGGAEQLDGATAFVTGASPAAEAHAVALAERLGLVVAVVPAEGRVLEHAACTFASNYLVTLLATAARILEAAGAELVAIEPLVRRTLEEALAATSAPQPTGPIARGDAETIERHREALAALDPALERLYIALGRATLPLVDPTAAERAARALEER